MAQFDEKTRDYLSFRGAGSVEPMNTGPTNTFAKQVFMVSGLGPSVRPGMTTAFAGWYEFLGERESVLIPTARSE